MTDPIKGDRWTCGTYSGFRAHRRLDEEPCDACAEAARSYARARYARDPSSRRAQAAAKQALIRRHRIEYRALYDQELARLKREGA